MAYQLYDDCPICSKCGDILRPEEDKVGICAKCQDYDIDTDTEDM